VFIIITTNPLKTPHRITPPHQPSTNQHQPQQRSNNRRTLWYTLLEVATIAAIGAFNVHFVSGLFKGASGYGRIVV
jgi:hypothetical protein